MTDPILPRVYCASPWHRHTMWQVLHDDLFAGRIDVVSSWHKPSGQALDDTSPGDCLKGWKRNCQDIVKADFLLAYAEASDRPNGTLFEIGYANSMDLPVYLVGNFTWGTWRFLSHIYRVETLREAIKFIIHHKELLR
jgi:nucleoside 2-deoxyribosyltransferase